MSQWKRQAPAVDQVTPELEVLLAQSNVLCVLKWNQPKQSCAMFVEELNFF